MSNILLLHNHSGLIEAEGTLVCDCDFDRLTVGSRWHHEHTFVIGVLLHSKEIVSTSNEESNHFHDGLLGAPEGRAVEHVGQAAKITLVNVNDSLILNSKFKMV